jgi:hypothetical protein
MRRAVTRVVELGPGNALARLMHELMPDGDVHSLSEFHSIAEFRHWACLIGGPAVLSRFIIQSLVDYD